MILRSSSSPILSSLVDTQPTHSSASIDGYDSSSASPLRMPLPPHHLSISAFHTPPAETEVSRFSMRRARSEGDLQSFGGLPSESDFSIKARWKPRTFVKFSIDEEDEETDSMVAECYSDGTRTSVPGFEDDDHEQEIDMNAFMPMEAITDSALQVRNDRSVSVLHERSESLNPMYMASGVGICIEPCVSDIPPHRGGRPGGNGGGNGGNFHGYGGSFNGDSDTTETYYQKLLQADPQNPLLLRNYAQYLCETKRDYKKSEEYYERAILASPDDGEVLSKYAKHVWDMHKDSQRAESYFERAVEATPDDCYVLASYASFLWESEDDEMTDGPATLQSQNGFIAAYPPLIASS